MDRRFKKALKEWLPTDTGSLVACELQKEMVLLARPEGSGRTTTILSWGWHPEIGFKRLPGERLFTGEQLFSEKGDPYPYIVREVVTSDSQCWDPWREVAYEVFPVNREFANWRKVDDLVDNL